MVTPGEYSVSLFALSRGEITQLGEAVSFQVKALYKQVLEPATAAEIEEFRKKVDAARLEYGAIRKAMQEATRQISMYKNACFRMEGDAGDLLEEVYRTEAKVQKLNVLLNGMQSKGQVGVQEAATVGGRLSVASRGLSTTYGPTEMHKESLQIGIEEMKPIRDNLQTLKNTTLPALEEKLLNAGAPIVKEL
jgi:hypothetical protein